MKLKMILMAVAVWIAAAVFAEEPPAEKVRFLTEKLGKSVVQVRYFFKNDDSGRKPPFQGKYWCSNCEEYHHRDLSEEIERQNPITVPGFLIGDRTIISGDSGFLPAWIGRIEILQDGKAIPLTITGFFPEQQALELTAKDPVASGSVLQFQKKKPGEKYYHFYVAQENGILLSGIRPAADRVIRCLDNQTDYAVGGANAILTDGNGNAVTVNFRNRRPLNQADGTSPAQWRKIPAETRFQMLKEKETEAEKSFYPVHIRLFAEEKNNASLMRRYGDRKKNDFYSVGVLIEPELLLVPVSLDSMQTARLERVNVNLPDGTCVEGKFAGSLRELGALLVTVPAGGKVLPVTAKPLVSYFEHSIFVIRAKNNNGKLQLDLLPGIVEEFQNKRNGEAQPEPGSYTPGEDFLLNAAGELMMIPVCVRTVADSYAREYEGASAQKVLAAVKKKDFDAENIPRSAEDRSVIAWLGANFQELTEELARVHNAASQTNNGQDGILISRVLPGSPANRAGLQTGDIVLYVRSEKSAQRIELDESTLEYSPFDNEPYPWDKWDELPEQLFDQIPPPWSSVESNFHKSLTALGIGKEVQLGVIRKGEFAERKMILEKAPLHYENAPRYSASALGLTVADPTFEVRDVIRLASGAAGVIISKVVPGSPASVAGIKPFEVIVSVNDKAIFSAEEFASAVKGQKELTFSVRRMAAVRTVKLSVAAGDQPKEQAK